MDIPDKLENLIYTNHSRYERCKDPFGFIEYVPRNYYKVGCKKVEIKDDKLIVTYIYNDERDLILIINPVDKTVITNWLKVANNNNIYKGRFRFSSI